MASDEELRELQQKALLREVDEELRQDQIKAMWKKYRFYIISGIFLIIMGAVAFEGLKYYKEQISTKDSIAYSAAADAAQKGEFEQAYATLLSLQKEGKTGYAELAALRSVALLEKQGKGEDAIALLYDIKDQKGFSVPVRNLATIALAARLLDAPNPKHSEIKEMLQPLASKGSPWESIANNLLTKASDAK